MAVACRESAQRLSGCRGRGTATWHGSALEHNTAPGVCRSALFRCIRGCCARRPNVLVILADDGFADVGFQHCRTLPRRTWTPSARGGVLHRGLRLLSGMLP